MSLRVVWALGWGLLGGAMCSAQRAAPIDRLPAELRHAKPASSAAEQAAWDEAIFRYYRVPVTDASTFRKHPVQIDTREKHQYRTLVRDTVNEKPSFANDVATYEIGCGTGCFLLSLVEINTGKSYLLSDVNTWNAYLVDEYRRDSRALHVAALVGREGAGDRWYVWEDGTLKLMRYQPLPELCFSIGKDENYPDSKACHFVSTISDQAEERRKKREGR